MRYYLALYSEMFYFKYECKGLIAVSKNEKVNESQEWITNFREFWYGEQTRRTSFSNNFSNELIKCENTHWNRVLINETYNRVSCLINIHETLVFDEETQCVFYSELKYWKIFFPLGWKIQLQYIVDITIW